MSGLPQGRPTFGAAQNVSAVVAYDLSAHMLDVVAQAAEARQLKNITTRQGYAASLPFADNAFELLSAVILPITGMMLVQHCEK